MLELQTAQRINRLFFDSPMIVPPINAETKYELAPVVNMPVKKSVLSSQISTNETLVPTSFRFWSVTQSEKCSFIMICKGIKAESLQL